MYGFIREVEGQEPPDPTYVTHPTGVTLRRPWSPKIPKGKDPLWISAAFAGRPRQDGYRVFGQDGGYQVLPPTKLLLDDSRGSFSRLVEGTHHRVGPAEAEFLSYRLESTGVFSDYIPLRGSREKTKIASFQVLRDQGSWPFEAVDLDCLRELHIQFEEGQGSGYYCANVEFKAFDKLQSLPVEISRYADIEQETIEQSQWLSVLFNEASGQAIVRSGRGWPGTDLQYRFCCLIGFHQAPTPNISNRVVNAIRIGRQRSRTPDVTPDASLSISWR